MTFDVTADGWLPHRGDYGTEYASDLITLVEARNCVLGCKHAGTLAQIREHGPGGVCHLLALMSLPDRVKGFEHDDGKVLADLTTPSGGEVYAGEAAPLCTVREDRPPPVRRGARRVQTTLFEDAP